MKHNKQHKQPPASCKNASNMLAIFWKLEDITTSCCFPSLSTKLWSCNSPRVSPLRVTMCGETIASVSHCDAMMIMWSLDSKLIPSDLFIRVTPSPSSLTCESVPYSLFRKFSSCYYCWQCWQRKITAASVSVISPTVNLPVGSQMQILLWRPVSFVGRANTPNT